MSKSLKTDITKFKTVYADDYKIIFPDGSVGSTRLGVFNQVIYSDELRAEKTLSSTPPDPQKIYVKRTIHCQLVMNPHQAKNLAQALTNQVEGYEKQFGKIPTPSKEPRKPTTFIA